MSTPIFLIIYMHIALTRLLKVGLSNTKYNLEEKICEGCIDENWGDNGEVEEAMAADNDDNDDKEDFQDKNRRWKKDKQRLK